MSLALRYAARSHVGLLRDGNEDSGYAGSRLLVVADGMGGQAAGELASAVTVSTLVRLDEDVTGGDFLDTLGQAVVDANERLREIIVDNPGLEGMGTTLTALLWNGNRLGMAHIGDSRAYRLRDGEFEQITADHTWVQRLIDEGRISPEEAGHHPQRSLLMRALDGRDQVEMDLSAREVRMGDRYLLCSDGLSGVVSAETLQATLISYPDPNQAADMLIQLALRGGGPDNITCIIADVIDAPEGATEVPIIVGAAAEARQGARAGLPQFGAPHGVAVQPPGNEIPETPAGRASQLLGSREQPSGGDGSGGDGSGEVGEEQPKKRRRRWRRGPFIILGVVLLVLVGLGAGGYYWSQQQYYVGETSNGYVAIYQGLSEQLAGFHLSKVYQQQQIAVSSLPPYEQDQLSATISASSLGDAQRIVNTLRSSAVECAAWRASVKASASASAAAKAHPTSTSPKPGTTTPPKPGTSPAKVPTTAPTTTAPTAPTTSAGASSSAAQNDLATTCGSTTGAGQ